MNPVNPDFIQSGLTGKRVNKSYLISVILRDAI